MGVKRGHKGDASVLKPTMMCCVPLILDRIYKNIIDSVNKRGSNFQKVFEFCYRYKLYWTKSGCNTPIIDKIIFNKIKALLGGRAGDKTNQLGRRKLQSHRQAKSKRRDSH